MKKRSILLVISIALVVTIVGITTLATAITSNRVITVDTSDVITEDFLGVGSNMWAGTLTDYEKITFDSNEANFAISERRIETIEPALMRMLVLPNWFVKITDEDPTGENNWKAGNYNFETSEIYTLCKYCEAFKRTDTEVQINLGGQVGEPMISWFAISDVLDMPKSAPADLESFAKSASALLQYLWSKGYDNVKSLSFYNETDLNNWQSFGDQREYWVSMLKCIDTQLKQDGIRDKVKIIGSELAIGGSYFKPHVTDWIEYIHDNGSDYYDELSVHAYMDDGDKKDNIAFTNCKNLAEYLQSLKAIIGEDKLRITEFSKNFNMNSPKGDTSFSESQASQVITYANVGMSAAANWFFSGTSIPQPVGAPMQGRDNLLWEKPNNAETVYWSYNEMGLLMRYIPKHSKVIKVTTNDEDIMACAFVKGDDITIVVETDESNIETRNLSIEFEKTLNKKFKRFICDYPSNDVANTAKISDGGNAILTPSDLEINVSNKLEDTLTSKHRMIIYTTMDEEVQIKVDGSVSKSVTSGNTLQLSVSNVYGTTNSNVTWSIYDYVKPDGTPVYITNQSSPEDIAAGGSIAQDGKYCAVGVPKGTKVAVKVTSTADSSSYQIVYITVK